MPGLEPGASSTLGVSVSVTDPTLDTPADQPHGYAVAIVTSASGQDAQSGTATLLAHLVSPPAQITAESALPIEIIGSSQETRTGQFVVPIRNAGGTSVPVHATVTLPTTPGKVYLPQGVSVTAADNGDNGWTCGSWAPDAGMTCGLTSLPRGTAAVPTTVPLVLVVTAGIDLADVNLATGFEITVLGAAEPAYASLTIRSGPARLDVTVDPTTIIEKGTPSAVTFTVKNTGQTTAASLKALVELPAGVFWDGPAVVGDWTCVDPGPGSNKPVDCTTLAGLAPGTSSTLQVAVHAPGDVSDKIITASVSAADGLVVAVPASTTLLMVESRLAPSAGP